MTGYWQGEHIRTGMSMRSLIRGAGFRQLPLLGNFYKQRDRVLDPVLICIGAQKSGTTALYHYLSRHPELQSPASKELQFFCCDRIWQMGMKKYRKRLPSSEDAPGIAGTFDISPNYMLDASKTAPRIRDAYPEAHIICLVRDRVERAFSCWQMYRNLVRENGPDWWTTRWLKCQGPEVAENIVRRKHRFGESFRDDIVEEIAALEQERRIDMPILEYGMYRHQIAEFAKHFSPDQMTIINSEKLNIEPCKVMNEICRNINISEIDWNEITSKKHFVGQYNDSIGNDENRIISEFYRRFGEDEIHFSL